MAQCIICGNNSGKNKTCSKECNKENLSNKAKVRMSIPGIREQLSEANKAAYIKNPDLRKICTSNGTRLLEANKKPEVKAKREETIIKNKSWEVSSQKAIQRYIDRPELRENLSEMAKNRSPEHLQKLSDAAKIQSSLRDTAAGFKEFHRNNPNWRSESQLGMSTEEWIKIINSIKMKVEAKEGTVSSIAIDMGLSQKTVCKWFHKLGYGNLIGTNNNKNQLFVSTMLKKFNIGVELNNRKVIRPKELDLYISTKNIAIEFNGLYWHSSANEAIKRGYHMLKYTTCKNNGVQLLAFYDDEFIYKKDIVVNIILNKLGIASGIKLNARELILKSVNKKEAEKFFNLNHLDGHVAAKDVFGLYRGDELVFALSTRTYTGSKYSNAIEIARLATKIGYNVRGGAGKLVSHIQKLYNKTIVSYSNNRLSNGNVYEKLGFIEDTVSTKPSYWYTDYKTRVFRTRCQRINDPEVLSQFPTEEKQALNGVFSQKLFGDSRPLYRIEDYGHRRWVLT